MKKALKTILALVGLLALIAGGAENLDGSCSPLWTFGCLAVAVASVWAVKMLDREKRGV